MFRAVRGRTLSILLLAALALGAGPASARPNLPGAVAPRSAAPVHALVELMEDPAAVTYGARAALGGAAVAASATIDQVSRVKSEQAAFRTKVAAARIPNTKAVYALQRVFNGVLYVTTPAGVDALKAVPGVKAVHLLAPKKAENAVSIPLVGAIQLWANAALPLRGEGVKIGIIDTGIDYTHANFGGPGTVAAYTGNNRSVITDGGFPTAKVVGGWDFAGAAYDAGDPTTATPVPDPDPLDGDGHGSHVAGTAAGLGVTTGGATYGGPYDDTLDPATLAIGPGAAPLAQLYALKVFGEPAGSTSLAYQAVEWAVDPNGDGNFADQLDVVNLSLGSGFGTSSDVEAIIYTNAVNAGLTVVASAGNAADVYFISGSPAATPAVISVAATQNGGGPAVQVNTPAAIAGLKAATTAEFGPPISTPITSDLVAAAPYNGCSAFTNAAAVAGKIALVQRGTCTFLAKTQNARAAGAIGVVIVNNQPGLIGMAGTDAGLTITARMVTQVDGNAMKAQLDAAATVNVTLDDALSFTPSVDQVASFSSRGPTRLDGSIALKPDVGAPGQNIISTAVGTGTGAADFSGTSMAAPLTTGVVALLRQLHPTWTPAELKALLMNTAGHDVFDRPTTDPARLRLGPGRVGAGRIDAATALSANVIAYDKVAPDRVSVSFQTTDVDQALTEARTVTLRNLGATAITFDPAIDPAYVAPGTAVTVPATAVTVPAGGSVDVTLQLSANPAQMTRARDATVGSTGIGSTLPRQWLSETSGWLVLTPQGTGNGPTLRVPFYAALTPASRMASSGQLSTHGAQSGTSSLLLQGTGVDTTGASALPPVGVVSLVTPFELAWSAPQMDLGPWNNASLRHVGVTSNLPDMGVLANSEIYFAISTYGVWGSHRELEFDVYVKRSSAVDWEYVLFNTDYLASAQQPGTDVPLSALLDLAAGTGTYQDFVNGQPASGFHLPTYLTDTIVLPVFAADLGLAAGDTGIDFQVVAWSPQYSAPVDQSPVLHFDLAQPAFAVGADPSTGLGGAGYPPTWVDLPGASIPVVYDLGRQVNPAKGMLLVHHHNAAGERAEAVPVVEAQALVVQAALAAGDAACPFGGVRITSGFDDDNDGVLDAAEVTSTQDVCNGAPGASGPPGAGGPPGKDGGCASLGGGSFASLMGLMALLRLRRRRS